MGYEVYFNKTVKEKRHTLSVIASWGTRPSKIYTVLTFTREEQITLLDWHWVREFHQWAEPWVVLELRKIRVGNFQRTAWEKCGGLARPTQPNLSPNVWFLWELEYLAQCTSRGHWPASKSCSPVTLPLVLCCPKVTWEMVRKSVQLRAADSYTTGRADAIPVSAIWKAGTNFTSFFLGVQLY